jgi:hypothetical protein
VLKNAVVFNYESKTSYSIRVRTTDAGGLTYDGTFTINVTNVNEAPTNIALSSSSISENVPTGTTIGTLSATDPDAGDTFTFELYDTSTYPDNSSFYIDGTTLKSSSVFNYETKSSYSIRVRATDANGLTFDKTLTITITNVTISVTASATTNVTCNGGSNGVITISDASGGTASYTYSKDGTNYQSSTIFSGLTAGVYTIYAKDSYNEVGSTSVTVTQPDAVSVSASGTNPTCYTSTNGSITVSSASGGSGSGYTYSKDGTNYQVGTTFSNLGNGTYTIYAKDSNGCVGTTSVTLNRTQVTATTSQINNTCYGGSSGSITVSSLDGGQGGPYAVKLNAGGTYQVTTTSRTYSSLAAGTYTIYVKDSADCENTYSVTITEPTQISISASGTNPTCWDGSDGSITVSASSGTGTKTYSINGTNYQSSGTFSSLSNGTYTVYAKDANDCVVSTSVTLNRTAPNATFTVTNVTCNGESTGSIAVTSFTGGNSPYRVSKDGTNYTGFVSSHTFSSLSAGTYTIYVKDNSNCVKSYSVTVTQPTALSISVTDATAPTCWNGSNGSITVSGSGGTGTKTYSINGTTFQSSGTFSSLTNGTYILYAKDQNDCVVATTQVLSKSAPNATISVTNVSCFNDSTGEIAVSNGTGGSGSGYQVNIGGGTYFSLPKTFTGLATGTYTIGIKDGAECTQTYSVVVSGNPIIIATVSSTNPTTYTGTGTITVSDPQGGSGSGFDDYQVKLNSGSYETFSTSSKQYTGLAAGNYAVWIKDSIGCERNVSNVTITIPTAPTAQIAYSNISCFGGSDGSYTISNPSGGSGSGYQVAFSEEEYFPYYNLPKTFSGLVANTTYTFRIKDSAGATNDLTPVQLSQPTQQTASISVVTQPNCDSSGVVQVSSSGGVFPKTYQVYEDNTFPYNDCINGTLIATFTNVNAGDATKNVTDLTAGYSYCVKVTDANGCVISSSQVVLNACVNYDYYNVEVYNCSNCTLSGTGVARFPAGSIIAINEFYVAVGGPDGYAYKVTSSTSGPSYVYDLTDIYGSFSTCAQVCNA